MHDPDLATLRDLILNPCSPGREFGDALISYRDNDRVVIMTLIHDRDLGYYLQYGPPKDTWLSLGDRRLLSEVVCPDDWKAAAGLFIPADKAWLAISEFCRSGERSNAIEWMRPSEVPDDGNW